MISATCPHCAFQGGVEAFFVDAEGKRLAAVLADVPQECGRAVIGYLGLFKPAKTALRTARAVKLASEVKDLIAAGTVCKDERGGVRRPASPAMWTQGIETMLAQRESLSLPLESHGYLRAVVFGIADKIDAAAERDRESKARDARSETTRISGPGKPTGETPLERQLAWIQNMVDMGQFTEAQAATERANARKSLGAKDGN